MQGACALPSQEEGIGCGGGEEENEEEEKWKSGGAGKSGTASESAGMPVGKCSLSWI